MGRPDSRIARDTLHVVTIRHHPGGCQDAIRRLAEWDGRLLARTVWGCIDGIHSASMVVEAADEGAAIRRLPESIRAVARATRMHGPGRRTPASAH
jgi:hypothetical protein